MEITNKKWYENISEAIEPHKGERETALFRIIPFDSLLQILNEKQNTMVRTSLWEDCYENFMMKNEFIVNGNNYSIEGMTNDWFGQCWTTKASSDAMWRIYSPDKKSVRIKTTVGRLWDSAMAHQGGCKFMLGKVQYFPQSKIQDDIKSGSPYRLSEISNMMISSLFVKRNSFSHESEWRLVCHCDKSSQSRGKDAIQLDINPLDFIMNIYFDPRSDMNYLERCRKILTKAFGYPVERIHKSTLYDFKAVRIEIK